MGEALQVVLEALESPLGTFAYINENGERIVASMTKAIWDRCEIPDKSYVFPRDRWNDTLWARCLIEQRTVSSEGPFHTPDGHIPITRALAVPIVYQGKAIGNFMVGNKASEYSDGDKELLETIATNTAPILSVRLQREKEEHERKRAEEALIEVEEFKNAILDSVSSHIAALDRDGVILPVNEPWVRFSLENGPVENFPARHTEPGVNYLRGCAGIAVASRRKGQWPPTTVSGPCWTEDCPASPWNIPAIRRVSSAGSA